MEIVALALFYGIISLPATLFLLVKAVEFYRSFDSRAGDESTGMGEDWRKHLEMALLDTPVSDWVQYGEEQATREGNNSHSDDN